MKFNGLKFKSIQGFIMTAVMSLISMLCIGLTIIGYNIAHMGNIVAIMALLFLGLGCVISYLIARQISKPLKQVVDCLTQIATGNLESDVGAVALARADEIGELGTVAQSIAADLRKKAAVARQIAEGNFNIQLPLKSERDILTQDFNIMTSNLQQVFSDINRLTEAAIAGNLAARADTTKHSGDYRKILAGVNAFLEVITVPFNDAEEVLQKMAVNDYTLALHPEKYQGVINQFAANINMVRNRLLNLQEALVQLAKGDTGMLAAYRDITKRSENDQILPALKATLRNFTDVIEEANRLVTSAVNGEMEIRGDINRFEGGYRQIVNGFNQVFDAISAPIGEVFNRLLKMASGDLDVQVNGNYQGCHGLLTKALNRTIDSFNEVLGELNSASNQVATGAQQVSKSSRMMSQGAAEQAANIEEITASISEIDTHTKQNATNATKANKLALGAQERATAGNGQMQKMLEAMTAINESSANIFKIIKVIDEIAFQTNILALNAAVEAARARTVRQRFRGSGRGSAEFGGS
jgi:methyl-accepting chemotaxis protein